MNQLKVTWHFDSEGNRHTGASYIDDQGYPRATQLNGHLMVHEVKASIEGFRKRLKGAQAS
ncbi:hypothetical protein HYP99_gp027 [Sinorhizobium phage ort11]|uniref:Uncharacterized protein n=1 Tax=Sinorhizobium phage ort11 TaxID=2599764 RepID=A0A5C2H3N8_9CAUD|nr:hypothetical protein HYP99_gp027 [Sinorhizobium phage ort11]QEP29825.1 hypothetical protein Smphiort11_027 [Sinorhizobium phage ort11]